MPPETSGPGSSNGAPKGPPATPANEPQQVLRPAVFLDRDGTLIEERNYPSTPEDIVALPGSGHALQRLASLGFLRIVLTNQSAIARGMLTEEELAELHGHLNRQLNAMGGGLDAIYYCPHHPEGSAVGYNFACPCRKPKRGLLDMALQEHPIDLSRSIFIGDSPRDLFLDAGPAAGRLLVRTGHPIQDASGADAVVPSLVEATEWILERFGRRPIALTTGSPEAADDTEADAQAPENGSPDGICPPDAPSGDVPHKGGPDEPSSPHGQP